MDEAISAFKAEGGKLASKQEVEMKRLKRQIRKVEKKLNTVCFFNCIYLAADASKLCHETIKLRIWNEVICESL